MERALIIGCGYTGTALARRLLAAGVRVTGTTAGPAPRGVDGLDHLQVDLLKDRPALPDAAGAVVYYMVSTLHREYTPDRPHLVPMARCLTALAGRPPRGLVYLSSTSVYGDRQGGWVDEETDTAAGSPWGQMRVELEQAVWDFGARLAVPACVVRLPEIYGPGRGPQQRLLEGYRLRHPDRFSNRIHIDDLVTVLELLGHRLGPRLLLASDDEPAPSREVYTYAAGLLGRDLEIAEHDGEDGQDANRRALRQESKRCRNRRLQAWLGRPLRHPTYREGIRAILGGARG